jgi:hypothetical protein
MRWLRTYFPLVLIAAALLLNVANANTASKKLGADHHKSEAAEQPKTVKQQEPEVPLSVLQESIRAQKEQSIAAEKQAEAYKETWCSPSVIVQAVLAVVGAGYLIFAGLQWQVLYWAFFAEHRPRLGIRRIALLNILDEILVESSGGTLTQPPIEVQLQLINRGGSDAKVIEGNVTVRIDKRDSIEAHLGRGKVLPPFDVRKGIPAYGDQRDAAKDAIIKPAEPYTISKMIPASGSPSDAAHVYLALHRDKFVRSVAFHVFGYFKYRTPSWLRANRSYYTAFCRRYDPEKGGFVVIDEPDYEYEE